MSIVDRYRYSRCELYRISHTISSILLPSQHPATQHCAMPLENNNRFIIHISIKKKFYIKG